MIRLVGYLLLVALVASGLAWLADQPGTVDVVWQGYTIETTVFRAAVILAFLIATGVFLWSLLRTIWQSPALIGDRLQRNRRKKGLDALSSGMIAVGAGDATTATRYALLARKSLPHEPLTQLLRAQAAQLSGDRATARRIYEAMLATPETEQLGLRGLFLEAEREGAGEAALQFAERAMRANPQLGWSSVALFDLQCRERNWSAALDTLAQLKRSGAVSKADAERRRAVLLTARAAEVEETEPDNALAMASEAHGLAHDLVPAAVIAGRIQASRGLTAKAAKILQRTWKLSPHPDIAEVYAFARVGDSTRDRFERVKSLAALNPHSIESPIAVAGAAIEARLFTEARNALHHLIDNGLTQRVATLMARVEAGDTGDRGKVRGWLARAVNAARDPVWMADGAISDHWQPISPVTGKLDAFVWRVPVGERDQGLIDGEVHRIEELLAIGSSHQATAASEGIAAEAARDGAAVDVDGKSATTSPAQKDDSDRATSTVDPDAAADVRGRARPSWIADDVEDAEAVTVRPAPAARPAADQATVRTDSRDDSARVPAADVTISRTSAANAKSAQPAPSANAADQHTAVTTAAGKSVAAKAAVGATTTTTTSASASSSATAAASASTARSAGVASGPDGVPRPDYSAAERKRGQNTDANLYVSPRAPDDPGPDFSDDEPVVETTAKKPFRATGG